MMTFDATSKARTHHSEDFHHHERKVQGGKFCNENQSTTLHSQPGCVHVFCTLCRSLHAKSRALRLINRAHPRLSLSDTRIARQRPEIRAAYCTLFESKSEMKSLGLAERITDPQR